MKLLLLAAIVAVTGCSGPERPTIMGVKFGEVYGAPVATKCEANQRFEMTGHDQAFSCQLKPPEPSNLFNDYGVFLSLGSQRAVAVRASTTLGAGCAGKGVIETMLKHKYGDGELELPDGRIWKLTNGLQISLLCDRDLVHHEKMNDTQLLEIEDSIENSKAECIRQISNPKAYKECVDKSLFTARLTAGILGNEWPSIDKQVSLIYVDRVTDKDVANKEYEELKAAYLTKLAKSSGL